MFYVVVILLFNNFVVAMDKPSILSLSQKIDATLRQKCINYVAKNIDQFKEIEQQLVQDLVPDIERKTTRNLLSQNTIPIEVTLNQKKITDQSIFSIVSHNNGLVAGMYQKNSNSSASISWWDKYGNHQELLKSCGKRNMTQVWHINDQLVAGIVNDVNLNGYRLGDRNENIMFIDTNSIKNSLCKIQGFMINNLSMIDHNRFVVADGQLKIWDIRNFYLISMINDHYHDFPCCVLDENHILTTKSNKQSEIICWDLRNNKPYDLITSTFQISYIKKLVNNTICYGQWLRHIVDDYVYQDSSNIVIGHCDKDIFIQDHQKVIEKDVLCNGHVGFWVSFYPKSIDLSYNNNFIIVSSFHEGSPEILLLDAKTFETLIIFLYKPQNLKSVCMFDDDTIAVGAEDGLSTINLNRSLPWKKLVKKNNSKDLHKTLVKLWQNK